MTTSRGARVLALPPLALCALLSGCGQYDALTPATPQGEAIVGLFGLVLVLSAAVLALVTGLLVYVLVRFRRRAGAPLAAPGRVTENRRLELIWTLGPLALVTVLFILAVQTMRSVAAEPGSDVLEIDVVGRQWWWECHYPAADSIDQRLVTANELHLPVGTFVRLRLTSADVQHDFWVPRLGLKRDLYPGSTNSLSFLVNEAGVLDGACAEYCGTQHAWMRIRIMAEARHQFDAWLRNLELPARVPGSPDERRGQQVFLANTCVNCHVIRGTSASGLVGPDLTHFGGRSLLAAGVVVNTPEQLYRWLRNPNDLKPGVLMPAYGSLRDDDLRALVTYLESLQ